MSSTRSAYKLAAQAAEAVRGRFEVAGLDAAFVLGTLVGSCPLAELPGFAAPTVVGHGGTLRVVTTGGGKTAAVFTGRTHLYEGRGVATAVHAVRTATAAGARTVVLTNGC